MHTGLTGTLVDGASQPLAGVPVEVLGFKPINYQVKTDGEGRFSLCLPPDKYMLTAGYTADGQPLLLLPPGTYMTEPGFFRGAVYFEVPQNEMLRASKIRVPTAGGR